MAAQYLNPTRRGKGGKSYVECAGMFESEVWGMRGEYGISKTLLNLHIHSSKFLF